ncbi:MAG TPA: SGNH/GDSL hydrolase family protein, partial [Pyrinomonadaceae bacterium]
MNKAEISEVPRRRRLLLKLVTLLIGFTLAFFLLEIGLRIVGYSSPEFYEMDDHVGYGLIPGMSGWYTREGRSWVEINTDGFRDVEHTVEKPPDVYRIAVIGDSYVEALQVDRGEMFTNYIAPAAANCDAVAGKGIEILTFGVSGYGTAQELLMVREKVWKYSPDLVLLVFTTNNDVSDNLRAFKQSPIPYFEVRNGELTLDDSFRNDHVFVRRSSNLSRLGTWLMNHLRLAQAYADVHRFVKYKLSEWSASKNDQPPSDTQPAGVGYEPGIDNQIYREPADDNWRTAWDVTERLIGEMDAEVRQRGARFAVVLATNGIQVVPNQDLKEAFARKLGVADLAYPNRRITSYCDSRGIRSIDLMPELAAYAVK